MKKNIIAANWKMHFDIKEAGIIAYNMIKTISETDKTEIVVCPAYTHLDRLSSIFGNSFINLGAQNMYFEEKGAFTGEISPTMLTSLNCKFVILGHSERRHIFKEDNNLINKKIVSAIEHNLTPILCVGETIEERNAHREFDIITEQIKSGLGKVDKSKVIIAYEPVWAIGTGVSADNKTVETMHNFIKETAGDIPILYGGSVKPSNAHSLSQIQSVNGFLVGGASLIPKDFNQIIKEFEKIKGES